MKYAIIDVETTMENRLIYDISFALCEYKAGKFTVEGRHCFLLEEIYCSPEKIKGAFYRENMVTQYPRLLSRDLAQLVSINDLPDILGDFISKDTVVCAYNAVFDFGAIIGTLSHFGIAPVYYANHPKYLDIWHASLNHICNTNKYKMWCYEHVHLSEKFNIKTSAEAVYCYLINNSAFKEKHTGYSDCLIEAYILKRILDRKKKIEYNKMASKKDIALCQPGNAFIHQRKRN